MTLLCLKDTSVAVGMSIVEKDKANARRVLSCCHVTGSYVAVREENEALPTKILIIESDEASFQVRQCIAKALSGLPPVELFHARDATEALAMLERLCPDVILLDDTELEEKDLFMDNLGGNHPPVVMQTEEVRIKAEEFTLDKQVTYIPKSESLEGIHQTLLLVAAIGTKFMSKQSSLLH